MQNSVQTVSMMPTSLAGTGQGQGEIAGKGTEGVLFGQILQSLTANEESVLLPAKMDVDEEQLLASIMEMLALLTSQLTLSTDPEQQALGQEGEQLQVELQQRLGMLTSEEDGECGQLFQMLNAWIERLASLVQGEEGPTSVKIGSAGEQRFEGAFQPVMKQMMQGEEDFLRLLNRIQQELTAISRETLHTMAKQDGPSQGEAVMRTASFNLPSLSTETAQGDAPVLRLQLQTQRSEQPPISTNMGERVVVKTMPTIASNLGTEVEGRFTSMVEQQAASKENLEEKPLQPFKIFTHQYASTSLNTHANTTLQVEETQPALPQRMLAQVKPALVQHFQLAQQNGVSEATIWLVPKSLGRLQIHVMANQGHVSAQIMAQTAATKEMLDSQMTQLRQALLQQGFVVDKLEVVQQPTPQGQNSTPLPDRDGSQQNAHQHSSRQQQQDQHGENEQGTNSFQEWFAKIDQLEDGGLNLFNRESIHYQV